jgi:hypothetical protein
VLSYQKSGLVKRNKCALAHARASDISNFVSDSDNSERKRARDDAKNSFKINLMKKLRQGIEGAVDKFCG